MSIKQLREEYSAAAAKLHSIADSAKSEERGLTSEEKSTFDELKGKCDELRGRIDIQETAEKYAKEERHADTYREEESRARRDEQRATYDLHDDDPNRPMTSVEHLRAIAAWSTTGRGASKRDLDLMERAGYHLAQKEIEMKFDRGRNEFGERFNAPKSVEEARQQSLARRIEQRDQAEKAAEYRAQATSPGNVGGFTVPDEMMRPIDIALLAFNGVRQAATILTTDTGADLPIPTTNDTGNVGEIIAENAPHNEQDVAFGQVVLTAFQYSSKAVKVSHQLMQDSATNMAQLLGRLLGERIGRIQNTHMTTGAGTTEPQGIVTAAADSGVTAAAAQLTFTEILALKHSVDPAYRALGGSFMCNDATLLNMKSVQDAQGRPLWLPSLSAGEPDLFDGDPVWINQAMAAGSSAKSLLYGHMPKYHIRDATQFILHRMDELFLMNLQVGFLGVMRSDGQLVDAGTNPVKYLTSAA